MRTSPRHCYYYERGKDGCDETFDIYAPGDTRPMVCIGFWEAEAEAEAKARRIVAALNACDGVSTEELERGSRK